MDEAFEKEQGSFMNQAEFEASLAEGIDAELSEAETTVVEPVQAENKKSEADETSEVTIEPLKGRPSWSGKILGHFKLLRLVGEGKMGRVIQAEDINLKRIVALKILNKRIPGIDDQESINQFLREARAASQIEHPNVVRIYEINHHQGWWYIAMELLEENLSRIVNAAGPLSPIRASAFIADAATGLAVAHELGIIHRDIKPTNLMLNRHGRCKLTDFGLVRLDDPNDPFDFTDKAVGSPHFIAPEMIERRRQSPAIDVYSLGATMYYALTGSPPFMGTKLNDILKKHLKAPAPDVRHLIPECPATLAHLIKRSMEKDPSMRPSAADFAAALRAETITWQGDASGLMSGSIDIAPLADASGGRSASTDRSSDLQAGAGKKNILKSLPFLFSSAALLVAVMGLFVLVILPWLQKPKPLKSIELTELSKKFKGAPETYGLLPSDTVPKPENPAALGIPEFSWVGKVDTNEIRFVASKDGKYFFPVDSPRAALIRLDKFVGYRTAGQAVRDGKRPAQ